MSGDLSRRALFPLGAALAGAAIGPGGAAAAGWDAQASALLLPAGVHRVTADLLLRADVRLEPGAVIDVASGATLTLLGSFEAPIAQVFTGAGIIDLNHGRIAHAHPEWWGAAPGEARDSLPALRACLAAHPVMHLLPADYQLSATFVVERPFSRITGAGHRGTDGWRGTRLILNNGTGDVMRVGPATQPPSVNDYPQNIEIRSLALGRSAPVDADGQRMPAGLSAQFLLFARFEQVSAFEHAIGFRARGLVRSQFVDCIAFRSLPGVRPAMPWRGFLLDGMADIGLAGGNASLFLTDCNATIGGNPQVADGVGLLMEGAFADSYIRGFEATAVATGIRVDGRSAAIGQRAINGQVNLHLHMPIIDQCGDAGIVIRDTGPNMLVDLIDPYVAAAAGAAAAIRCEAMGGSLSIVAGQMVGGSNSAAGGAAAGLLARDCTGLQVSGLKILDHGRPVELTGCRGFSLQGWVANPVHATGGSAVLLRDCARGSAAMIVEGRKGAFAGGVRIEGGGDRIRIDATAIDDAALTGGLPARVKAGDTPMVVPSQRNGLLIEGL